MSEVTLYRKISSIDHLILPAIQCKCSRGPRIQRVVTTHQEEEVGGARTWECVCKIRSSKLRLKDKVSNR